MQNKEIMKVSNILINQPLLISARQFDVIMFVGLLLQKRQINFNDEKFIELSVTRNEIKENLSLNEKISSAYIDRLFYDLREKSINYSEEDYNLNVSLISVYERKEDIINIFIYNEMARLFLELKNKYTIADFDVITNLTSIYSKRIYLLCMQYRNLDNKREFNIDNLKIILGADSKYKEFQNFKVRVLERVKKEINKIMPQLKFNYALIKQGREYDSVLFTFDFSFIPKQEQPQQEQPQVQKREAIFISEPVQYNRSKREYKVTPPTLDDIYLEMQSCGARIDAEVFYHTYNDVGWLNEYGRPISWKAKVREWGGRVLKNQDEFKRNAEIYRKWEIEYNNRERYAQMTAKMNACGVKKEDFIKAIVDEKMEHLFNFEKGKFKKLDEDTLKLAERQFMNWWSEYKDREYKELRDEDMPF